MAIANAGYAADNGGKISHMVGSNYAYDYKWSWLYDYKFQTSFFHCPDEYQYSFRLEFSINPKCAMEKKCYWRWTGSGIQAGWYHYTNTTLPPGVTGTSPGEYKPFITYRIRTPYSVGSGGNPRSC